MSRYPSKSSRSPARPGAVNPMTAEEQAMYDTRAWATISSGGAPQPIYYGYPNVAPTPWQQFPSTGPVPSSSTPGFVPPQPAPRMPSPPRNPVYLTQPVQGYLAAPVVPLGPVPPQRVVYPSSSSSALVFPSPRPGPSSPRPPKARSSPNQPGQFIFQADVSPQAIAYPAQNPPPMQGRFSLVDDGIACQCPREFKNQARRKRHWDSSCPFNLSTTSFQCDNCDKSFGRLDNYRRHLRDIHKMRV